MLNTTSARAQRTTRFLLPNFNPNPKIIMPIVRGAPAGGAVIGRPGARSGRGSPRGDGWSEHVGAVTATGPAGATRCLKIIFGLGLISALANQGRILQAQTTSETRRGVIQSDSLVSLFRWWQVQ
jgi:hypothetical protein